MLARVTSAITLLSMILVMVGSTLHTHGYERGVRHDVVRGTGHAHVDGPDHVARPMKAQGGAAVDSPCSAASVDAPSQAVAHDGSDCSLCKVTKERVVVFAAAPLIVVLSRPAPRVVHVLHDVCVRSIVRAAGRAPPLS